MARHTCISAASVGTVPRSTITSHSVWCAITLFAVAVNLPSDDKGRQSESQEPDKKQMANMRLFVRDTPQKLHDCIMTTCDIIWICCLSFHFTASITRWNETSMGTFGLGVWAHFLVHNWVAFTDISVWLLCCLSCLFLLFFFSFGSMNTLFPLYMYKMIIPWERLYDLMFAIIYYVSIYSSNKSIIYLNAALFPWSSLFCTKSVSHQSGWAASHHTHAYTYTHMHDIQHQIPRRRSRFLSHRPFWGVWLPNIGGTGGALIIDV